MCSCCQAIWPTPPLPGSFIRLPGTYTRLPQNSAALRDADEFAGVAKEIARLRVGGLSGWASFWGAEDAVYGSKGTNPRVQYADGLLARARACPSVLPATLSWPLSICLRTISHACPPVGFLGIPAAGIPGHAGAGTGGGQECVQGPAGETPMPPLLLPGSEWPGQQSTCSRTPCTPACPSTSLARPSPRILHVNVARIEEQVAPCAPTDRLIAAT